VSPHRAQVAEALKAILIRSRYRFEWLGESSPAPRRALAAALTDASARALMVRGLATRLYECFYCTGGVVPNREGGDESSVSPDPALVAALSRANAGHGSWQRGWHVDDMHNDELVVARDGIRVRAGRSEWRAGCRRPRIGAQVSIRVPQELPALSPGFFTVVGDVDLDTEPDDLVARLYFNVSCTGSPMLVAEVTSALNRARVPFRLKVVDHPERFARCDAAVLYLHAADVRRRRRLLRRVVEACAAGLQPSTPVFTKPLGPGVGLGEERGAAAESFGMRRCLVLAEAVVKAHQQRIRDLDARVLLVERYFADCGIDPDAPHLAAGSEDGYSL
jgi:type III HopA1-like effector protein